MTARTRVAARVGAGLAAALAGLTSLAVTAAAAPPPNTGTWANASNMQWACTATGPAGVNMSCHFQGPASCTETVPSSGYIGGCAVTLSSADATLTGCSGASTGATFAYSPSVGEFASGGGLALTVHAGTATLSGTLSGATSTATVSASFTFVCPLPGQSGTGRVNWSGQVNES
ncbi:MAG TPA: hypothetical protein VN193_00875 [Candidatus Angelobacter sp.]|jgi:hypothetical protein|nr:hypothetical protein [Candidatus Angelobacter sp.]